MDLNWIWKVKLIIQREILIDVMLVDELWVLFKIVVLRFFLTSIVLHLITMDQFNQATYKWLRLQELLYVCSIQRGSIQ